MMKILVLGSEGFIGSHLVEFFRAQKDVELFEADIVLKESPNYFLVNPEIPDFSFIFSKEVFDVCINATGAANVQLSFNHPSLDFTLNAFNVYNILDAMRRHNQRCKFINLSSAAVYGNPKRLPVREVDDVAPVSPYGFHKWYSEQICSQFFVLYKIPTVSLRIFSAYGEGLKKQLFWDVYKKVVAADSEKKIVLYGTGLESRDFIYVKDICKAIAAIIERASFHGESINVASGVETTIRDAVTYFVSLLNSAVEVKFGGEVKRGDPLNWRADVSQLKNVGFEFRTDIKEGLQKTAGWLKERR
jgi:UDP-glucose 4-epimerase